MGLMNNTPTPINSYSKIKNLLSPIFVPINYNGSYTHVRLELWVWTGDLKKPVNDSLEPTITLYQEKINYSDETVLFEISEYIRNFCNPRLKYDGINSEINAGQVFFQWQAIIINNPNNLNNSVGFIVESSETQLGLLGYNFNFQDINKLNFDYSFGIKKLKVQSTDYRFLDGANYFDVNVNIFLGENSTSDDVVNFFLVEKIPNYCPKEKYVIWYINQAGLWDYFSPTGKVSVESTIKRDTYNRTVTRPDLIKPGEYHGIKQINLESNQSWTVNTGFMNERLGQIVEAIMVSPMVYLIQITDGVAPGTYISRQIPLINDDTSFGRKTRLNNKGKISYQMKFKETTNKILNNR